MCVPTHYVDVDNDELCSWIIQIIADKSQRFQLLAVETTAVRYFRTVLKCRNAHQGTKQCVPAPVVKRVRFSFELNILHFTDEFNSKFAVSKL
jgi:hypothetical protein